MRSKLVWLAIFVVMAIALGLTTCRRFPNPTEPTLSSGNSRQSQALCTSPYSRQTAWSAAST